MHGEGVSSTCLAGWWHHHGGFPTWLDSWLAISHAEIQQLGITHPIISAHRNTCRSSCKVLTIVLFQPNWNVLTNLSRTPNIKFRGNPFSHQSWVGLCNFNRHSAGLQMCLRMGFMFLSRYFSKVNLVTDYFSYWS
jgi:hypothetical protein